mmetsp:Transcript_17525/g.29376  ORF Transcript_17525/g.29376 Transcript_17525/m.29376 type:complete len:212 (+) Transcript_17525:204-839(+)
MCSFTITTCCSDNQIPAAANRKPFQQVFIVHHVSAQSAAGTPLGLNSQRFCRSCCRDPREVAAPVSAAPWLLRLFFLLDASSSSKFSPPDDEDIFAPELEPEAGLVEKAMKSPDSFLLCPPLDMEVAVAAEFRRAIFLSRVARKLNFALPPAVLVPLTSLDLLGTLSFAAGVSGFSASGRCLRARGAPGSVKDVREHTKQRQTTSFLTFLS